MSVVCMSGIAMRNGIVQSNHHHMAIGGEQDVASIAFCKRALVPIFMAAVGHIRF